MMSQDKMPQDKIDKWINHATELAIPKTRAWYLDLIQPEHYQKELHYIALRPIIRQRALEMLDLTPMAHYALPESLLQAITAILSDSARRIE